MDNPQENPCDLPPTASVRRQLPLIAAKLGLELIGVLERSDFCRPERQDDTRKMRALAEELCCSNQADRVFLVRLPRKGRRRERYLKLCEDCAVKLGVVW